MKESLVLMPEIDRYLWRSPEARELLSRFFREQVGLRIFESYANSKRSKAESKDPALRRWAQEEAEQAIGAEFPLIPYQFDGSEVGTRMIVLGKIFLNGTMYDPGGIWVADRIDDQNTTKVINPHFNQDQIQLLLSEINELTAVGLLTNTHHQEPPIA